VGFHREPCGEIKTTLSPVESELADVQNRPEGAITERNVPRTNSISDFLCIFCDANKHREIVARD
jgi:hypothetical protein